VVLGGGLDVRRRVQTVGPVSEGCMHLTVGLGTGSRWREVRGGEGAWSLGLTGQDLEVLVSVLVVAWAGAAS
jgi:L-aminopeptidase/D-esterase-like protein